MLALAGSLARRDALALAQTLSLISPALAQSPYCAASRARAPEFDSSRPIFPF